MADLYTRLATLLFWAGIAFAVSAVIYGYVFGSFHSLAPSPHHRVDTKFGEMATFSLMALVCPLLSIAAAQLATGKPTR